MLENAKWEYCQEGWCAAREASALGGRVLLERYNRASRRYDHIGILPNLTESEFNQAVTALISDGYGAHAYFVKLPKRRGFERRRRRLPDA